MNKYIVIMAALLTVICLSAGRMLAKPDSNSKSDIVQKHHVKSEQKGKNNKKERGGHRDPFLRLISEELNLSDEQKSEISELLKERREKYREEERAKRDENHNEIIDKIKSDVLTPEQSAKLDDLEAKRKNGELLKGRIYKRIDKLSEDLQLTADQKEKMAELFEKQRAEREMRRDGEHPLVRMDREKQDEFKEELALVLTNEQLKKFEEIIKENMQDRKGKKGVKKDIKKHN